MYINKAGLCCFLSLILAVFCVIPDHVLAADFKILYPESNSTVKGEVIEIEGAGATAGATIEISVLTNDWYLQDGKAEVNDDGRWSYAPCYLRGKGKFNNHTIKARLIKDGKAIAIDKVRGVVRE
ncbi:MAG: hypothetical protein K9K37_11510 [Desulfocapsa sp.]|nr:hypothetical protein [Desulfocapsa sp.]